MKTRKQYAALPYVIIGKQIEVLLITRRRSGRWIIPKGWPEDELPPHKLAALEAFEEAGLEGRIEKNPIGRFTYVKQIDNDTKVTCLVDVFPLRVKMQYLDWPERNQRRQQWLKPAKASRLIGEKDLARLIEHFEPGARTVKTGKQRKRKLGASV